MEREFTRKEAEQLITEMDFNDKNNNELRAYVQHDSVFVAFRESLRSKLIEIIEKTDNNE